MDTSSQLYSTNTSKPMGEAVSSSTTSGSSRRLRDMENLSLEISKYPRDLLQRFLGANPSSKRLDDSNIGDEDDGGLNLGLGLSLGGKFGVDKSHKGLVRSSSIIGTMPLIKDEETVAPPSSAGAQTLVRTSSLPVETEEEWRKRKEMQTLRRMEAKRRRSEKQRILKESGGGEEKGGEGLNFRGRLEREQQGLGISNKSVGSSVGNPFGSSTNPPIGVKRRTTFGSLQGFLAQAQAQAQTQAQAQQGCSQGSRETQGGSSSGASELESKTHQGSSSCGEARSPASIQSLQGPVIHESGTKGETPSGTKGEIPQGQTPEAETSSSKQPDNTDNRRRETSSGGMEDMPCVFTIGDGPNGRKVEGILYRYGKGEEVRIMCVCHGSFFSPVEFVKHAGGRDVEHPLRHIVVSPSASPFQ